MELSYQIHYKKAQESYLQKTLSSPYSLDDIGVRVIETNPAEGDEIIELPGNYLQLTNDIALQVADCFTRENCCFSPPYLNSKSSFVRLLKDSEIFTINGIEALARVIIPQLESLYYHSFLHLDKVYVYRSLATTNNAQFSWLWHYDNHPACVHKILIYLTNVDNDHGPFEYLRSHDGVAKIIRPSREGLRYWKAPEWKGSRVPARIMEAFLRSGYETHRVLGPPGTMIVFDNNCVHRANLASTHYRDVMTLQVRPAKNSMRPFIDPRWTGGFESTDIERDPDIVTPRPKYSRWMGLVTRAHDLSKRLLGPFLKTG